MSRICLGLIGSKLDFVKYILWKENTIHFDRLDPFPEVQIDIKAALIVGMALPLNRRHAIMWTKND